MNEVTIKGEVKFVDEIREYGANGFKKHQVVVETGDGRWDNPIPVEFIKDSIQKSKDLEVGNKVTIEALNQRPGMAGERWRHQMVHLN